MSTYFNYIDSLGATQTQAFDVSIVKGLESPWKWNLIPPQALYNLLDGNKRTDYRAFQRIFSVELRALNSNEDFIRKFLQADNKWIKIREENITLARASVVYESAEYEDEWLDGFKLAKKYAFELTESAVRRVWPFYPSGTDMIYIINHVKVEGSQDSPETFVTNVGKLQYNFGTTPFPDMFVDDYLISITGAQYQSCKINQVGTTTQDGSNISFQLAYDMAGNPADDGFYYCDIAFLLQAKA